MGKFIFIYSKDADNAIFHIGLKPDGTMQSIINARLPFSNHTLLKGLLNTERLGGQFHDCYEDGGYFFMYDNSRKKPYRSVMIWKYIVEDDRRVITDVKEGDLRIIPYAADTYLR